MRKCTDRRRTKERETKKSKTKRREYYAAIQSTHETNTFCYPFVCCFGNDCRQKLDLEFVVGFFKRFCLTNFFVSSFFSILCWRVRTTVTVLIRFVSGISAFGYMRNWRNHINRSHHVFFVVLFDLCSCLKWYVTLHSIDPNTTERRRCKRTRRRRRCKKDKK